MMRERDPEYLLLEQYRTGTRLRTRIDFYERFSSNPFSLYWWIFDRLKLPAVARVLELGCGNGCLWSKNGSRIPQGWKLTLTDLSAAMLREAKANLAETRGSIEYRVADAQFLPFPDGAFDGVIANYMLYHVPNLGAALREVVRTLAPSGRFYAATNGAGHLHELSDLYRPFDSGDERVASSFTLENGEGILRRYFGEVRLERFEDTLEVDDPSALVAFVLSKVPADRITIAARHALDRQIRERFASGVGSLRLAESTGLFEAWEPQPSSHSDRYPY
jgi:SAM-dependent methyltransferase